MNKVILTRFRMRSQITSRSRVVRMLMTLALFAVFSVNNIVFAAPTTILESTSRSVSNAVVIENLLTRNRVTSDKSATTTSNRKSSASLKHNGKLLRVSKPATVVDSFPGIPILHEDFESGNNFFTLSNGSQTNKWRYGSATASTGSKSIYISSSTSGTSYNISSASVVHAFTDLPIPSYATNGKLKFDWKINGESCCDYVRVWIVPATYALTAGTQISSAADRIQIGGNFNNVTTWQTYTAEQVDVSKFAGQNMRLVFEWRNDGSVGTAPAAIDNVDFEVYNCNRPLDLSVTDITFNSAKLNWSNTGEDFEVEYGPKGFTRGTGTTYNTTVNYKNITGLTINTDYEFYVRNRCTPYDISVWAGPFDFSTAYREVIPPFTEGFESGNDYFKIVNGSKSNKWFWGDAVANNGSKSLYISKDNGTTSSYNMSSSSVVHAYMDVNVPTDVTRAAIKFDVANKGESTDLIKLWLVPATYTPVAGSAITSATNRILVGSLYGYTNWTTIGSLRDINVSAFVGTKARFVFEWSNDANGAGTGTLPVAIDNIEFDFDTCGNRPSAISTTNVTFDTATINVTSTGERFEVEYGIDGFIVGAGIKEVFDTKTIVLQNLQFNSSYKYYIRSYCEDNPTGVWLGPYTFKTLIGPATMPYFDGFENTPQLFQFVQDNQANKWVVGTAIAKTGSKSLYLYDTSVGSSTNGYKLTSAAVSSAYRDVFIPEGTSFAELTFDYNIQGESSYDYVRVWVAPYGFMPTAGTQIGAGDGRKMLDQINLSNGWKKYLRTNVDVNQYAGSIVRLIFEWRNDASSGGAPVAIDNVEMYVPDCVRPNSLSVGTLTNTTAVLKWEAPEGNYEIELGYAGFEQGTGTFYTAAESTKLVENLDPNTYYEYYVRQICSESNTSLWVGPYKFITKGSIATSPFEEDFEQANSYLVFVNGTQTNKWAYGSAIAKDSGKSIYISNNEGQSNAYTINFTSRVHAYFDIAIPETGTYGNLSFDWNIKGEANDYMRVWVVPTSFTPSSGTAITASGGNIQIGTSFYNSTGWTTYTNPNIDVRSYAGQNMRIVFEWINNASSGAAPVAFDNVSFIVDTCNRPLDGVASEITNSSARVSWSTEGNNFEVEYGIKGFEKGTGMLVQTTSNTGVLSDLLPNKYYEFYLRQICSDIQSSVWTGPFEFLTLPDIGEGAIVEDFESENPYFVIANLQSVNKWFHGTAVAQSGTHSMYISNTNGVSNAYTNTTAVVGHTYANVTIPANSTFANLTFKWNVVGDSNDFIRVWMVPASYTPVSGTGISSGDGKIQIGGNLNLSSGWQTYSNPNVDIRSFAGQTMRLVFEWTNNNTGGVAPVAIDDISFIVDTCLRPEGLSTSALTSSGATLNWIASGDNFEVEYGITGFEKGTGTLATTSTNSITIDGLVPNKYYQYYVRQLCSETSSSVWVGPFEFLTNGEIATVPYFEDFENENPYLVPNNGTSTSKWIHGEAIANGGGKSLYLSKDNGLTNSYVNTTTNTVQTYVDIAIPEGSTFGTLSFDWNVAGDSNDYIRVWVAPSTFIPTAGTQIAVGTDITQIGSNFTGSNGWQTYTNTSVNVIPYAGSTVRLIFEWRNNNSGGAAPAAIDNISFVMDACHRPIDLTASNFVDSSVQLSWSTLGSNFEVEYGPKGFVRGSGELVTTTTNSVTLSGLSYRTEYDCYVRQLCEDGASAWSGPLAFTTVSQTAMYEVVEDFTGDNVYFTLQNGTQTNKWIIGNSAYYSSPKALYISNNNSSNSYSHTASTVHAFTDVQIREGSRYGNLSFKWYVSGEECCDYLRVWIAPVSFMPTPGVLISEQTGFTQLVAKLNLATGWNTFSLPNMDMTPYGGQIVRLIFEWRNDHSVGAAPVVVDNISFVTDSCIRVEDITTSNITENSATVSWTTTGDQFEVEYGLVGFVQGTGEVARTSANSVVLDLLPNMQYSYYVRHVCDDGYNSIWKGPYTIITPRKVASVPLVEDFEDGNDYFSFTPTNYTNRWTWGRAMSNNSQGGLYISNDYGVNSAYTNTTTSYNSSYADIQIPEGSSEAALSFDWNILGEPNDYVNVWLAPASFTPSDGTLISASTSVVKVGSAFYNSNGWENYYNGNLNVSAYAGGTMRLIFQWVNNNSGGVGPVAIDNVNFSIFSCTRPTNLNVSAVTSTSATLNWSSVQNNFEVQYGTLGFDLGTGININVQGTTVTLENLAINSAYEYYVRGYCEDGSMTSWAGPFSFVTDKLIAHNQLVEDFEGDNKYFKLHNNTTINKWYHGSALGKDSAKSLYISSTNGQTSIYNNSVSGVVFAYADITISEDSHYGNLSFDWNVLAESCCDYVQVWLAPDTFVPTLNTMITASSTVTQVGGNINQSSTWNHFTSEDINISRFSGKTMRLIFQWRTDGSAGSGPVAIDNVSFISESCFRPEGLTAREITSTSAVLGWSTAGSNFEVEYAVSNIAKGSGTVITADANSIAIEDLLPNKQYKFYVRTVCGVSESSKWVGPYYFNTPAAKGESPYTEDFEGENPNFVLVNGSQTNYWMHGSAISSSPSKSLYITNNGTANAYSTTTSRVHAYADFDIPAGSNRAELSFKWNIKGDATDYVRVLIAPATFTPTAGSTITTSTSIKQVVTNLKGYTSWQTYSNTSLDVSYYAGSTMRLIFEWRNSSTVGGVPVAIDDITFIVDSCNRPTSPQASGVTTSSANLSWVSAISNFEVEYGPVGFTIGNGIRVPVNGTSFTLNNLSPNTAYQYYVRGVCDDGRVSNWTSVVNFITQPEVAVIPFEENFTSGNTHFVLNNGTQTNKWVYGTAVADSNNGALYISNNGGSTNAYNNTSSSVVHTFVELAVPSGARFANVSFDWKVYGESNYDYVRVWAVPASYTPSVGNLITAAANRIQIGGNFNGVTTWQTYTNENVNVSAFAGSTMRLVFEWRNDASGGDAPAAIDNIRFDFEMCDRPSNLASNNITTNSANLTWDSPYNVFEVQYGESGFAIGSGTVVPTTMHTLTLNDLVDGVTYDVYVRNQCTEGSYSGWFGPYTFTTLIAPATVPYVEGFEDAINRVTLVNGTYTNKWIRGTAIKRSGSNSMYISNNGSASAYTNSATSVTHFYRDIIIPENATAADLSFDWYVYGESCCDYIQVWMVPTTFTPAAGTSITAGQGRTLIAGKLNQVNAWTTYTTNNLDVSEFAGTTMRLVFQWKNDHSMGSAPAAVDNINFNVSPCPTPIRLAVDNITQNTAEVSWFGQGTNFEIEYGINGFTQGTGTVVASTTNSVEISGLERNRTYQVYVRNLCEDQNSRWSQPLQFSTVCGTFETLSENFDSYNTGSIVPSCWVRVVNSGGNLTITSTTPASGSRNMYLQASSTSYKVMAVLPEFSNLNAGTHRLRFKARSNNATTASNSALQIGYTTDLTTANFVALETIATGTSYTSNAAEYKIYIPENLPQGARLAFFNKGTNSYSYYIDDVVWEALPSCLEVRDVVISDITANAATLSWTSEGDNFEIEYGLTGFTQGTGTVISSTATSKVLENLNSNKQYDFYIRRICNENETSIWTDVNTFKTLTSIATLPFFDDFENDNSEFILLNTNQYNKWFIGSAAKKDGSTGMYISTSQSSFTYNIENTSIAYAYRDIEIPAEAQTASVSFNWRLNGESSFDYMRVWIVPTSFVLTPGTRLVALYNAPEIPEGIIQLRSSLASGIFNLKNSWQTYNNNAVDLSQFAGTTVRLVFEWVNDASVGSQSPLAIDNVSMVLNECEAPTNLTASNTLGTSATLGWTSDLSDFEIEYGVEGFTLGTGIRMENVTNPITIENLSEDTTYEFYVRAACPDFDGFSPWAGPLRFTKTDPCPAPSDLGFTRVSGNVANLFWQGTPTHYDVVWDVKGFDPELATIVPVDGNNVDVSGLVFDQPYEFYVRANCDADYLGLSSWVGPFEFKVNYCVPTYAYGGEYDNIVSVRLETLVDNDVPKSAPYYYDRSEVQNAIPNLSPGSTYMISVNMGADATQYSRIWIDFNQDQYFSEDESFSANVSTGANSTAQISFTVPLNIPIGRTKLRLRAGDNSPIGPDQACGASGSNYGRAVDYNVNITLSYNWTGAVSSEWENPGNWSSGVVPSTDDSVLINITPNNPVISTDVSVGSIRVNYGANLTIGATGNLIQSDFATNFGKYNVIRTSNPMVRLQTAMWASPVASQDLRAFSPQTLANRIYYYDHNYNDNPLDPYIPHSIMGPAPSYTMTPNPAFQGGNQTFIKGRGYFFRVPNNFSATEPASYTGTFSGLINNGDVFAPSLRMGYHSLGNPYPSSIDARSFLLENTLQEEGRDYAVWGIYMLDTATSRFGNAYNLAGSNVPGEDNLTIQKGQGFLVWINSNSEYIRTSTETYTPKFTNAMRNFNVGTFNRLAGERHRLWLDLSKDNTSLSTTLVGYMDGATNELDMQYDAPLYQDGNPALYSVINNLPYTIQGRALPFENTDTVPLGVKINQAGTYVISLAAVDGLFAEGQDIVLVDTTTNAETSLNLSAYEFVSDAGQFNNRFYLKYSNDAMSTGDHSMDEKWVVYSKDKVMNVETVGFEMKKVEVIDLLGRTIYSSDAQGTRHHFIKTGANQVVIVRVTTTQGAIITKKVTY